MVNISQINDKMVAQKESSRSYTYDGMTVNYVDFDFNSKPITYFGYNVNELGQNFPIFITNSADAERRCEIGKNGQYEAGSIKNLQLFLDITKVSVPQHKDISFVLDYITGEP